MSLSTLIVFATEAAEEESSKTPFYVLGGLLAAYAVAIAFAGMAGGASFPGTKGQRNGVIALSIGLVAATLASAILTG